MNSHAVYYNSQRFKSLICDFNQTHKLYVGRLKAIPNETLVSRPPPAPCGGAAHLLYYCPYDGIISC